MNNKGFTLVEILGVIVILGLLFLLVTPPVLNSISSHKNETSAAQKEMLEDAADLYFDSHSYSVGTTVSIQTLINSGFLNESYENQTDIDYKCVKVTSNNPRKVEAKSSGC